MIRLPNYVKIYCQKQPGQQPNMPCTHRQQLSRHKRLGYCLICYRLMTEAIYTLIYLTTIC
jgi:hypothetical protein